MANRKASSSTIEKAPAQVARQTKSQGKEEKPETAARGRNPKTTLVTVIFNVTVPEGSVGTRRNVYLAGNLSQAGEKLKDWDAQSQKLKKIDNTHWTITLKVPENTILEYKYTLGDWEHVEQDMYCNDIPNRQVKVLIPFGDAQVMEDMVQNWRSSGSCG